MNYRNDLHEWLTYFKRCHCCCLFYFILFLFFSPHFDYLLGKHVPKLLESYNISIGSCKNTTYFLEVLNFNQLFSNSTGSSATSGCSSPFIVFGHDRSKSNSNRFHFVISFFIHLRYIHILLLKLPLNFPWGLALQLVVFQTQPVHLQLAVGCPRP